MAKTLHVRCHVLLLLALASVAIQAQISVPSTIYTLHGSKLAKGQNGWADFSVKTVVAPDHAFLVLLPQADGQWLLKRLTAWETADPTEQTLSFAGALLDKDHFVWSGLVVDANGKYLIVRTANDRHVTVVVVDLANFTVVSRSEADDDDLKWLNPIDNADKQYDDLAGKNCHRVSLSDGEKYASYNCYVEHNTNSDGLFDFNTSRKYKVLSLPDGKPTLSISSVSRQPAVFSKANGHDYLLVLRDNVKLEVFGLN